MEICFSIYKAILQKCLSKSCGYLSAHVSAQMMSMVTHQVQNFVRGRCSPRMAGDSQIASFICHGAAADLHLERTNQRGRTHIMGHS